MYLACRVKIGLNTRLYKHTTWVYIWRSWLFSYGQVWGSNEALYITLPKTQINFLPRCIMLSPWKPTENDITPIPLLVSWTMCHAHCPSDPVLCVFSPFDQQESLVILSPPTLCLGILQPLVCFPAPRAELLVLWFLSVCYFFHLCPCLRFTLLAPGLILFCLYLSS